MTEKFVEGLYGFVWGAANVVRRTSYDGTVVLGVETDAGRDLDIYVSPQGKSVRVFLDGKRMFTDDE